MSHLTPPLLHPLLLLLHLLYNRPVHLRPPERRRHCGGGRHRHGRGDHGAVVVVLHLLLLLALLLVVSLRERPAVLLLLTSHYGDGIAQSDSAVGEGVVVGEHAVGVAVDVQQFLEDIRRKFFYIKNVGKYSMGSCCKRHYEMY